MNPELNNNDNKNVDKTPENKPVRTKAVIDPKQAEKLAKKEEKAEKKRAIYRERRLKKHEKFSARQFELIDKAEVREKAKAKGDPTQEREVELLAQKKRKELEASMAQQKRIIETSTGSTLSYEKRKSLYGYGFISIWIIGVIFIFLGPLITSIGYSLNTTTMVSKNDMDEYGMSSPGIHLAWNNFYHYEHALTVDGEFTVDLATSLGNLAPQVAMILIFSLFVAILLNQKFKGRTLMRAIFFFPVLIATGPVISVINGTMMSQGASGDAAQFSTMFQTDMVEEFMQFLGLNNVGEKLTTIIGNLTSDIFNLLWKSGIQILIFLTALQQIPTASKEAASMEGATAWEFFWKITFPTISPMILANLIYTIIDTFSDSQNLVMRRVMQQVVGWNFGYGAAMAWIYFGIIAIALIIVVGIVSKFVFYQVD